MGGSKGYFNPRLKLKDINRKRSATIQKPKPPRSDKEHYGSALGDRQHP